MDFFERQDKARRSTTVLGVYFGLAVLCLVLVVYCVCVLIFSRNRPINPELFLWVSLGTLGVIAIGSLTKVAELARGGSAVAEMLGGQLLNPNTTDPDERKLLNVVEEMSIASGVPVPKVYVLHHENSINAFAAGHTVNNAAIGVTRGCMKLLNRDELQGVIAHEFSHILNGDMRLNVRLIGIIFGIMCLAIIGRILLYVRGSSRDRNPLPLVGLALIAVGGIGVLFGKLIQAAVSRQREFLADSSAVQFTRNPGGLANALKKIGGLTYGSNIKNPHAQEASHMFFGAGLKSSLSGMFATHPPLAVRIKAIEPSFDGKFAAVMLPEVEAGKSMAPQFQPGYPPMSGLAAMLGTQPARRPQVPPRLIVAEPGSVTPSFGAPQTVHLVRAAEIRDGLSPRLQDALHDAMGASATVYALLLSGDEQICDKQLTALGSLVSPAMPGEVRKLHPEIAALPPDHSLPLLDLSLPGLRQLAPRQFAQFKEALRALIEMDGQIDLFEYVLQKIVLHHLAPHFEPPPKRAVQYYALKPLVPDSMVLLSALAYVGQDQPQDIEAAFNRGAATMARTANVPMKLLPESACDLDQVDQALTRIGQAVPQIKKNVLNACAHTVAHDGQMTVEEAELLRAFAATLDCPLPPFVA